MLSSLGISDWLTALIACWLAAQLPLGMFVGSALRRATLLSTVDVKPAPARLAAWSDFLPTALPRVF